MTSLCVRSILITGASRGLGLEFVKQIVKLPKAPSFVIAACRNPESALELKELATYNPNIKVIKLDVESDDTIEEAFQTTKELVGDLGLNVLLNNAGVYDKSIEGNIKTVTRSKMQAHFDVNVTGHMIVVQKFLPLLRQAVNTSSLRVMTPNRSAILNMSSIMGSQQLTYENGNGTSLLYKCSKTACTMMTLMMSRELRRDGILVNSLHPGWVRTEMGGPKGHFDTTESVQTMLKIIGNLSEETNGFQIGYQGRPIPF